MRPLRRALAAVPAALLAACAWHGAEPASVPAVAAAGWTEVEASEGIVVLLEPASVRPAGAGTHHAWIKTEYRGLTGPGTPPPAQTLLTLWEVDCERERARRVRTESFSASGAHLRSERATGTPSGTWASHWFRQGAQAAALKAACTLARDPRPVSA